MVLAPETDATARPDPVIVELAFELADELALLRELSALLQPEELNAALAARVCAGLRRFALA